MAQWTCAYVTVSQFGLELKLLSCTSNLCMQNTVILYTTKHLREKTFVVGTKIEIQRENFHGRSFL